LTRAPPSLYRQRASAGLILTEATQVPARFATGAALNPPDPSTFFSGGTKGYTDDPALA